MPNESQQESVLSHDRHAFHNHDEAAQPYLKLPTEPFVARKWSKADPFPYRDNIIGDVDVTYAGGTNGFVEQSQATRVAEGATYSS